MQIRSFFQLGIIARLSLGLISILISLLFIADIFFEILPNKERINQANRELFAKSLAIQLVSLIQENNTKAIKKTIDQVAINHPDIFSIGIRKIDGQMQFYTSNHLENWHLGTNQPSTTNQIRIPIMANNQPWGNIEISFESSYQKSWIGRLLDSYLLWMCIVGLLTGFLFYVYLNRVLHYLDPSKAVPSRVESAFDIIADGIVVLDKDGHILLVNDAFKKLAKLEENALFGKKLSEFAITKPLVNQLNHELPWEDPSENLEQLNDVYIETSSTDDESLRLLVSSVIIDDHEKNPRGYLVTFRNISELHKANQKLNETLNELKVSRSKLEIKNQQLQEMAYRDSLTGCLNRRAFFEQAENSFASATQANRELFCVMADIDFFKSVNDVYGHYVGDQVIQIVSKIFSSCLRPTDLICRYGGEEFCILFVDITEKDVLNICERMRAAVEASANKSIRNNEVRTITSSFGLASIHSGANSIETLIDYADSALYMSKKSGRNRVSKWLSSYLDS